VLRSKVRAILPIFNSPSESGSDMGKGIVVPIVRKYVGVEQACLDSVKNNKGNIVGQAFRYSCKSGTVYNLFSKEVFWHKAGYSVTATRYQRHLKSCLEYMRNQMLQNGEKYLAMPKIACGLDRCKWEDVEQIIRDVFEDTNIEILVCII